MFNNFENLEKKRINVSQTLHMSLAHSWEFIEINGNHALDEYSDRYGKHQQISDILGKI